MANKYSKVLEKVSEKVSVPTDKEEIISQKLEPFLKKIQKRISKLKLDVEVFIGGSYAKGTLIKKKNYDVDIYLRFSKKYDEENFTKLTKKILKGVKGLSRVKGSRIYFKAKINPWLYFEVVPVCFVKNPREAKNITDLSYSHVNYIKKKIRDQKILEGIKLAKAFCLANRTYGAESYVHGFSGYSLELLVHSYGGFIEFLRGITKKSKDKIIIDIEKHYKNKKQVMMDMNGSKLESPVVLIDPTFKRRNALAALTDETFEKFKESAKNFLRSPSIKYFEPHERDLKNIQKNLKKGQEFVSIEIKTKKQEGDIAGTKLLKFFKHLKFEFSYYFDVVESDFEYEENQKGIGYFILERKKEVLLRGPAPEDKKHAQVFSTKHKNVFVMGDRLYTRKKVDFSGKEFLQNWMKVKRKKIKEMYIRGLKIIN